MTESRVRSGSSGAPSVVPFIITFVLVFIVLKVIDRYWGVENIPAHVDHIVLFIIIGVCLLIVLLVLVPVWNRLLKPFGYRILTCPYCPDVSLDRIEYNWCEYCGERYDVMHGAWARVNGEEFHACSSECLRRLKAENIAQNPGSSAYDVIPDREELEDLPNGND